MTILTIPLSREQIDAANCLYNQLTQWKTADNALWALAEGFPQWDVASSLLKVAAVNQLYATNLYAVMRMAEHVALLMAHPCPEIEDAALVERIAKLPTTSEEHKPRRHYSFASKLAHFFVDANRFPICDSLAVPMVEYHLGRDNCVRDDAQPYQAYVENLRRLSQYAGLAWSGRDLDKYLWLAGSIALGSAIKGVAPMLSWRGCSSDPRRRKLRRISRYSYPRRPLLPTRFRKQLRVAAASCSIGENCATVPSG